MQNVIGYTGDQEHGDYVVVPAEPNYFAIDRVGRGDWDKAYDFEKIPVIAWLVEVDNFSKTKGAIVTVKPICPQMLSSLHCGEVVSPDGEVFTHDGAHWNSFEDFCKEERAKRPNLQTAMFNRSEALNVEPLI